ncbi:MAG: oligosaccharide flippase family protein [Thaumarchaeota archaeon]|nr:oligosaccharide flippase family protein [Nitrososphaerota archaeon]
MSQVEIARRSTRGSFALFGGNLLSTVFSFVAIVFIARFLGPSQYGVYTLAVLIPTILLNFVGFGVNSGVTRFAAYHLSQGRPELAKRMTVNGVTFLVLFGASLAVVSYAGSGILSSFVLQRAEISSFVQFASLLIVAQTLFQAAVAALLGWSEMGNIGLTNILQGLLRLAITLPLLVLGFAVLGALTGYVFSVALAGALSVVILWRNMSGASTKPMEGFVSDIRTMLSYGKTLFVGQFVTNISAQYVVVILATVASNTYVGFYQSAANFVIAITLTSGAISQALFPAFAHLQGTEGDVTRAFTYATKYTGFVLTPIIFLLMGASIPVIQVSLGSSYGVASSYLALLAFSNVSLLFGAGVLPSFFNGVGQPKFYMEFSLVGAVLQVVLAPLFTIVLGLGILGLIASTLVSNIAAVVSGVYLASHFFRARIDIPACLSILVSSILAFLVVLPLEVSHFNQFVLLLLEIGVFAGVYLTAAPLLRAIRPEDLEILGSALVGLGRFKTIILPILAYERFILRHSSRRT